MMIIDTDIGVYLKEQVQEAVYSYEWTYPTGLNIELFKDHFNEDKSIDILKQIKESNQKIIQSLNEINKSINSKLNIF